MLQGDGDRLAACVDLQLSLVVLHFVVRLYVQRAFGGLHRRPADRQQRCRCPEG
jgi:hypothetical protein